MIYEAKGVVKSIGPLTTRGDYSSRKAVLIIGTQYPQTPEFECGGKYAHLFDNLAEGQEVTFKFVLNGREWVAPDGTVKVFNSLKVLEVLADGLIPAEAAEEVPF